MIALEKDVLTAAYEAETELEARVTRRRMRACGLTLLNIRRRVRGMVEEGELHEGMTREQVKQTLLDDLYGDNPWAFEEAALDWSAILAFLEKLLPLILSLIQIFAV